MIMYVAFLRGINVGSHKDKMVDVKNIFTDLGFSNVRSYISSGNVFFSSPSVDRSDLVQKIESALKQSLGYEIPRVFKNH